MDAVRALKRLINKHAIVPLKNDGDKYSFKLTERQPNYGLTVYDCPADTFVFMCDDKFPSPNKIFRGDKGECKRADYIIVSSEIKNIVIIELKHSKQSSTKGDVVSQLKGANCLLEYCESVISSFWGDKGLFVGFETKYIKYIHRSRKRSFKTETMAKNDSPDKFRIIYEKSVPFNMLV